MPNFRRFLIRRWVLAFVGAAALVFGLLMLHPYPRQSLFGPTIRGKPWCVWEAEVRRFVHKEEYEKSLSEKIMSWLGVKSKNWQQKDCQRAELFHDEEMLPLLLYLLDDADPRVRYCCLDVFTDCEAFQVEQALPALYRCLQKEVGQSRAFAAAAIWRIKKDKNVIDVLIRCMNEGKTDAERSVAAYWLLKSDMCDRWPEMLPQVAKCSRDPDGLVRRYVMEMMPKFGAKGIPVLLEGLSDNKHHVRCCAVESLDRLGVHPKEAIRTLVESLNDMSEEGLDGGRKNAARMLGRWGANASAAIPELEKLVNDPDRSLREAAIDALLAIDPERFQHLKAERKIK